MDFNGMVFLVFYSETMIKQGTVRGRPSRKRGNRIIENMSETNQIIIGICILIVVVMLSRKFHAWKIKRAYFSIVRDIKAKSAFDPKSAVDLPYARNPMFRVGLRDHRPIALEHLVQDNIVGVTEDGRYYLKDMSV